MLAGVARKKGDPRRIPGRPKRLKAGTIHEQPGSSVKGRHGPGGGDDPERMRIVADLLGKCWSPALIARHVLDVKNTKAFLAPDGHPVAPRTVYEYVARVRERLQAEFDEELPHRRVLLRLAIVGHYQEAMAARAFAAAGRDLDRLALLDGLYVERREHSGPNGGPIAVEQAVRLDLTKLTDQELELLERVAEKAVASPPGDAPGGGAGGAGPAQP